MPTWPNTWQVPRICAGLDILEHEDEQVVGRILALARRRPASERASLATSVALVGAAGW